MLAAGLGDLLGAAVMVAVWLAWLRLGGRVSSRLVDHYVETARKIPARWRWTYGPWGSDRMQDADQKRRAARGLRLPMLIALPMIAAVLVWAGIAELRR
jgi:hypothetical protein